MSWFWKLRNLCLQYDLPHPSAVLQHWQDRLRSKASSLSSLRYLRTGFLGLTRCHPLFRTCSSSPWEVEKASTQARLLLGRFRLEALTGHWVPWNKGGMCVLADCWDRDQAHKGTVESFLLSCPSHQIGHVQPSPHLLSLVMQCLETDPVQFLLDSSVMAPVITAHQAEGESFLYAMFK